MHPSCYPSSFSHALAADSSDSGILSRQSSFSRDANDGNIESELSGIPSDQWSASSSPVFGEQDQSHFPNSHCLEGTYSFGRRISDTFSKNTNDTENILTSGDHTIPRFSTSTTQTGAWLSHENHHSSRLFGQDQFVDSGLDLRTMVSIQHQPSSSVPWRTYNDH
jgi:hypothetical protein